MCFSIFSGGRIVLSVGLCLLGGLLDGQAVELEEFKEELTEELKGLDEEYRECKRRTFRAAFTSDLECQARAS